MEKDVDEVERVGIVVDPARGREVVRLPRGGELREEHRRGEELRLDVDLDRGQVRLDDLRPVVARRAVLGVQDGRCRHLPRRRRQGLGGGEIRAAQRVEVVVPEPGHPRRENLVRRREPVRPCGSRHRRPVERVVDRLPQLHVREERPARIERDPPGREQRIDEELLVTRLRRRAAGAEVGADLRVVVERQPVGCVVDAPRLDVGLARRLRDVGLVDDCVEEPRPFAAVVRVAPEHRRAVAVERLDVVRAGRGHHGIRVGGRCVERNGAEQRQRETREEVSRRPLQLNHQLLLLADRDPGDRARLAGVVLVRSDDVVHVVDRRRAHARGELTLERVLERLRRDGFLRGRREVEARQELEGVGLGVGRDRRRARGDLRHRLLVHRPRRIRIVHELGARRELELGRGQLERDRGIDRVERALQVDPQDVGLLVLGRHRRVRAAQESDEERGEERAGDQGKRTCSHDEKPPLVRRLPARVSLHRSRSLPYQSRYRKLMFLPCALRVKRS